MLMTYLARLTGAAKCVKYSMHFASVQNDTSCILDTRDQEKYLVFQAALFQHFLSFGDVSEIPIPVSEHANLDSHIVSGPYFVTEASVPIGIRL